MADIKTFTNFKDWALIVLLSASLGMQYNTNSTVNELAKNDAVKSETMEDFEKRQIRIEAEIELLKKEHQKTELDVVRLQEYIKPEEQRRRKVTTR